MIEAATQQGRKISGFLTDLTKAFNNLPRPVVYACALHYGLPAKFVKAWHHALLRIQRHFVVAGAVSGPVWSTNGYPEGDPLSVVAMVLVNLAMHAIVANVSPVSQVMTFVDNWEGISHDVALTCRTFAAMEEFAVSIDLQLDQKKTMFWANNADDRKTLRQLDKQVILHGSDLGGHLNYSRKMTNYSSRARIEKNAAFWGALMRSAAPIEQKLRAIAAVAWPRALHGISGVALAGEHFGRLRAHAMACLRWNKKGASSVIQFGLGSSKLDPGFVALLDTVVTFRTQCCPDIAFPVLSAIVNCPPRHLDPGPCGVLIARLHEIQWQWDGNGYLVDHEGIRLHPIDSPIQYLKLRLRQAWEKQVGSVMQERKDFAGLSHVDVDASRPLHANTGEERGILAQFRTELFTQGTNRSTQVRSPVKIVHSVEVQTVCNTGFGSARPLMTCGNKSRQTFGNILTTNLSVPDFTLGLLKMGLMPHGGKHWFNLGFFNMLCSQFLQRMKFSIFSLMEGVFTPTSRGSD